MKITFILLILSLKLISVGCKNNNTKNNTDNCIFRSICGVTPSKEFTCDIETPYYSTYSFIANHRDVLSWVYNWPPLSSSFEYELKNDFINKIIKDLENNGEVLFTGGRFTYWINGKGKIFLAKCLVTKVTDSKSKCCIDISYLGDN